MKNFHNLESFDRIDTIQSMIQDQVDICKSLYPDRVSDALLKCYYDLVDIEMDIEDE